MTGESAAIEPTSVEQTTEETLREELYDQFNVSPTGKVAISFILPLLDLIVKTESGYDIDPRSKILAEISLYEAYKEEPKFKIFAWATILLGTYDYLHTLNPAIYGITFIALATLNGFVSSLRSPSMMAAELEGAKDEHGMPADYRSKALSSVNTNVTLVLFVIAVGVQMLVTSSIVKGEVVSQNVANGVVNSAITAFMLLLTPFLLDWYRRRSDAD